MSSFVDPADMEAMESALDPSASDDDVSDDVSDESVESDELLSSDESSDDLNTLPDQETVTDVNSLPEKEHPYKGFVPRSRLNDVARARDDWRDRYEQLQSEWKEARSDRSYQQPTKQDRDSTDRLLESIYGPNHSDVDVDVDNKLLQHIQTLQSKVESTERNQREYQIRQQWDIWNSQTDDAIDHFKTHANIDIPRDYIVEGIRGSQGSLHPHEIAERYVNFAIEVSRSLNKQPATEPQVTRRSVASSKTSNKRTRQAAKDAKISSVQDAHEAALSYLDSLEM